MITRIVFICALIMAGEMIFSLPFHTARFFRPTLLEVFGFTNTELGDLFAIYGVTAMLSYFPGGILADRFSARGLITVSLLATAAGGLYMATFPSALGMAALYGYWGITTIFLFWGALLKATRNWGGQTSQGRAFGILDGGRGLAAAVFGLIAVSVLSIYLPADATLGTDAERRAGFRSVILFYSAATVGTALLTWLLIPATTGSDSSGSRMLAGMKNVLGRPVAWMHAAIIICGYCGYKGLDNYSLYAVQVMGMDEVEAARFTAYASYTRPIGAVAAGLIADRFLPSKTIGLTFFFLVLVYGLLSVASPGGYWTSVIYVNLIASFLAVFAVRGIYFALLEETQTPVHLTGTTVGMVSFVGYTPEIFFAPIGGRLLDYSPGLAGHQHYFMFLAACMILGLLSVAGLLWFNRRQTHGVSGNRGQFRD